MLKVDKILVAVMLVLLLGMSSVGWAVPPVTSNLQLHLDASSLTGYDNGDVVSLWPDLAGRDNDASSSGTPTYIANALNGLPAISITGKYDLNLVETGENDDYYAFNEVTSVSTVAMVFKRTIDNYYAWASIIEGATGYRWHADESGNNAYWGYNYTAPAVVWGSHAVNGVDTGGGTWTTVSTDYHLMTWTVNNTYTTPEWGGPLSVGLLAHTNHYGNTYGMDVAEVLIYDDVLDTTELGQVTDYLMDKYAIPEPATLSLMASGVLLMWRRKKA